MSKPPLPRPSPPSPSLFSNQSSTNSEVQPDEGPPYSEEVKAFFDSFQTAERFSQIGLDQGRGVKVVREMYAVLMNAWINRDQAEPQYCIDKHEGRTGQAIYVPPSRGSGGVVTPCTLPCTLAGNKLYDDTKQGIVNIIHHNISFPSPLATIAGAPYERRSSVKKANKKEKVQSNFTAAVQSGNERPRYRGRFVKKGLVSVSDIRATAPSIPLTPKNIREILKHWVIGDPARGLSVPLSEFTYEMINTKDATGKGHKALYSKRRTVSLAVLIALRDAVEKKIPFSEAFGLRPAHLQTRKLSITKWEELSRAHLKEGRGMSKQDVIALGKQMYTAECLKLLPE